MAGRDVLAYRLKLGVVGPDTNTIVQPDFDDLRPPGVTNHYSRIYVEDADGVSDDSFVSATNLIGDNTLDAVRMLLPCKPDHIVIGMSAVTFYGGLAGAEKFTASIVNEAGGVGATVGSTALTAALRAYPNVKPVAFLSPYFSVANRAVSTFLHESGLDVVRDIPLGVTRWTAIAEVPEQRLIDTIKVPDGEDVDAIVQVGANLSMISLAAVAHRWLGKPVTAINTASYWAALRACKIADRVYGFGRLLETYQRLSDRAVGQC